MKLLRLKTGELGDDVARLHEQLALYGVDVSPEERKRKFFGPSTREAVRVFQRTHGLDPSGEVCNQTAALLSSPPLGVSTVSASSNVSSSPTASVDLSVGSITKLRRLVGYFPAWGIHAMNYNVADIPADTLTHVIYAFAGVSASGACVSISTTEDSVNLPRLLQLKQDHPQLRTLISVGGASHSTHFPHVASSEARRHHFAESSIQFMKLHGFDGIDIDWEFPAAADSRNFTELLKVLRRKLDAEAAINKRPYILTIAAPAGSDHYSILELNLIHPLVDWINLMAYDFSVASSRITDFVAPLKPYDLKLDSHVALNVDAAVQAYLKAGVPSGKLVIGTRFVGTGWQGVANINNGLYQGNSGPAKGTWDVAGAPQTGSFGYQDIENNYLGNYSRNWHSEAQVPWLYSAATGVMISYEDPQSLAVKANYALSNALGGVMIWHLGADDKQHTLLNALSDGLGQTNNLVAYTVSGQVTSPDSASIGGLQVQLVDKVVGPDVPLGETTFRRPPHHQEQE